ncbi:helix-turn-helix domain-containing protein [Embleya sp. NPDC005575]|uniref:helix-turn-helix domain-containing protein n=1 Tax=Embleya sp. NPDC005575 TaxID=3156892 RepID=UPI0033A39C6C
MAARGDVGPAPSERLGRAGRDLRPGRHGLHLCGGDRRHRPGAGPGRGRRGRRPGPRGGPRPGGVPAPTGRPIAVLGPLARPRRRRRSTAPGAGRGRRRPGGRPLAARTRPAGRLQPRHLTRLFHERVGSTPAVYVEAVRIEAAQSLLAAGATVTAAAAHSGLGSDESLRRAFLRRLGITPSAYRARFRSSTGG